VQLRPSSRGSCRDSQGAAPAPVRVDVHAVRVKKTETVRVAVHGKADIETALLHGPGKFRKVLLGRFRGTPTEQRIAVAGE